MTQPEDLIVGKSVEEIEAESGNRVNSPVSGEDRSENERGTILGEDGAEGALGLDRDSGLNRGTVLVPGGAQTGAGALGGLPGVFGTETGDDDRDSSEE